MYYEGQGIEIILAAVDWYSETEVLESNDF